MKPELLIQSLSFSQAEILAEAIHRGGELLRGEVKALSEAEVWAVLIYPSPQCDRQSKRCGTSH